MNRATINPRNDSQDFIEIIIDIKVQGTTDVWQVEYFYIIGEKKNPPFILTNPIMGFDPVSAFIINFAESYILIFPPLYLLTFSPRKVPMSNI